MCENRWNTIWSVIYDFFRRNIEFVFLWKFKKSWTCELIPKNGDRKESISKKLLPENLKSVTKMNLICKFYQNYCIEYAKWNNKNPWKTWSAELQSLKHQNGARKVFIIQQLKKIVEKRTSKHRLSHFFQVFFILKSLWIWVYWWKATDYYYTFVKWSRANSRLVIY